MATTQVNPVLRFLRRLTAADPGEPSDGQLLARFVRRRDEDAFAELLRRHGPMVHGVCRRVLHDPNDADDAFQATFLVLVRRAGSIGRPELLGNWLYGVAYRTALKARAGVARRRAELRPQPEVAMTDPADDLLWRDLRPVLDEELSRLPDKYRTAVVLCDLEGRTHEEAARRLGCPRETLTTRLTRARARLRTRLARRGLTLTAGLLTTALADKAAPAAVPAGLANLTLRAALHVAAGQAAAGAIAPQVAALTGGVLRAMFWDRLTRVAVLCLALGVLGAGVVAVTRGVAAGEPGGRQAAGPAKDARPKPTDPAPQAEKAPSDREKLQGTWVGVTGEREGIPFPERQVHNTVITIKGDEVVFRDNPTPGRITFTLDARRTPRLITMTPQEGPDKGRGIPWIYELDGDRLKLCWDTKEGKKIPTKFSTGSGDGFASLVLRRLGPGEKPPEPVPEPVAPAGVPTDKPEPAREEEPNIPESRADRADREKLQGTWMAVRAAQDGHTLSEAEVQAISLVVQDHHLTIHPGKEKTPVIFRLDALRSPKLILMTAQDGPDKGTSVPGIYDLQGDRLVLCFATRIGGKVPTEFVAPAGSGRMVLVLKRGTNAVQEEREKLQGTWQAVSGERDGQPLEEEFVKNYRLTFTGDKMKMAAGKESGEGSYRIDPSQKPKTLDVLISEPEKGIGIYELDGDKLRLCMVEGDGLARPTEFAGKDKAVLLTFKRVPDGKKP